MIGEYVKSKYLFVELSVEEVLNIRMGSGAFDIIIDEGLAKLLDENIMETTRIHTEITQAIEQVGEEAKQFYNAVYISVLNDLLSRTIKKYDGRKTEQ